MSVLDNYETAHTAFLTKAVLTQDNETLLEHLHGLSNQNNINTGTQHRDIIRGITINNILLQRHINSLQSHITALDAKNSRLQWWVMALAVAALASAIVQTTIAIRGELRATVVTQTNSQPLPQQLLQSATPNQVAPPSSRQSSSPKN